MAKITIKLAPTSLRLTVYGAADLVSFVKNNAASYEIMKSFHIYDHDAIAAEEAFDLTNNPARQEERLERYGDHRSVSVGDIVDVDGVDYICDHTGWVEIN